MSSERIKIADNFYLDEYIPKKMYLDYERKGLLHRLEWKIDERVVDADQKLRNEFGPTTINNWWNGDDRQWSGLRIPGSKYYSIDSDHGYGRASDKIYQDHSAETVRNYIRKYWETLGITIIEDGVSWVHSGTRYILNQTELKIV